MDRPTMLMEWKNQYCENEHITTSNLWIQCNANQNSHDVPHRVRKISKHFFGIAKDSQYPKKSWAKEEQWGNPRDKSQVILWCNSHKTIIVLAKNRHLDQ